MSNSPPAPSQCLKFTNIPGRPLGATVFFPSFIWALLYARVLILRIYPISMTKELLGAAWGIIIGMYLVYDPLWVSYSPSSA